MFCDLLKWKWSEEINDLQKKNRSANDLKWPYGYV